MSYEIIQPPANIKRKPLTGALLELSSKYELIKKENKFVRAKDIERSDLEYVLDVYANDLRYDLYSACEIFHISKSTLYRALNNEDMQELLDNSKERRSEAAYRRGYEVLEETYENAKTGEASRDVVNSANNLAKYLALYGQSLNPTINKSQDKPVNIQINLERFNDINPIVEIDEGDLSVEQTT